MINAEDFVKIFLAKGYNFWTGVPCSILGPLINYLAQSPDLSYISAASEAEAMGICIGAHLAGKKTVMFFQNSGLGDTLDPLTSLNYPFRIPVLLMVSHRGAPETKDEPQHLFMGAITERILDILEIPWKVLPLQYQYFEDILNRADEYMSTESRPFALIMKKDTLAAYPFKRRIVNKPCLGILPQGRFMMPDDKRILRREAIRIIKNVLVNGELIISTTGKVSRELFALGHSPNQFYVLGGMGCASAIGLGLSLCQKRHKIVVLDGDGAVLMNMGVMATIGYYRPSNFIHIVLDNEAHESTGGQATVSGCFDFAQVASASSYRAIFRCDTENNLKEIFKVTLNTDGPILIHIKVALGSDPNLGRPTLAPVQIKEQFMKYIAQ